MLPKMAEICSYGVRCGNLWTGGKAFLPACWPSPQQANLGPATTQAFEKTALQLQSSSDWVMTDQLTAEEQ